jgi:hypothetical protein
MIGIPNHFLDGRGEAAGVAGTLGVRWPCGFSADRGEKRHEEVHQRVGKVIGGRWGGAVHHG